VEAILTNAGSLQTTPAFSLGLRMYKFILLWSCKTTKRGKTYIAQTNLLKTKFQHSLNWPSVIVDWVTLAQVRALCRNVVKVVMKLQVLKWAEHLLSDY
jgi:hypothetical protein